MKKITKIFSVFLMAFILIGCGNSIAKSPGDVDNAIKNKESFILVVSKSDCSYCKTYTPIVEEFVKGHEDVKVMEVVFDEIKDEKERVSFVDKYSIVSTPTTLFFNKGEVKTVKEGVLSKDELNDFAQEYLK